MADQSGAIYSTGGSLTRPDFSGKVCQTEVDSFLLLLQGINLLLPAPGCRIAAESLYWLYGKVVQVCADCRNTVSLLCPSFPRCIPTNGLHESTDNFSQL